MPRQPILPITPESLQQYNQWRQSQNLPPVEPPERKELHSIYISKASLRSLLSIASRHNYRWANKPSLGRLLEAIANGDLIVMTPQQYTTNTYHLQPVQDDTDNG